MLNVFVISPRRSGEWKWKTTQNRSPTRQPRENTDSYKNTITVVLSSWWVSLHVLSPCQSGLSIRAVTHYTWALVVTCQYNLTTLKVTSLLRVWRWRCQVNPNLMTALMICGFFVSASLLNSAGFSSRRSSFYMYVVAGGCSVVGMLKVLSGGPTFEFFSLPLDMFVFYGLKFNSSMSC